MGCGASQEKKPAKEEAKPEPAPQQPAPASDPPPPDKPMLGVTGAAPTPWAVPTATPFSTDYGPWACDFNGTSCVYWVQGGNLMTSTTKDFKTWGGPWTLVSDGMVLSTGAAITINGFMCVFYVSLIKTSGNNNTIWYKWSGDGATYSDPIQVAPGVNAGPISQGVTVVSPMPNDPFVFVFFQGQDEGRLYYHQGYMPWAMGTPPTDVNWQLTASAGFAMSGTPTAIRLLTNTMVIQVYHQGGLSDQTLWEARCSRDSGGGITGWTDERRPGSCYGNPGAAPRKSGTDYTVLHLDNYAQNTTAYVLTNDVADAIIPGVNGITHGIFAMMTQGFLYAVYRGTDGRLYVMNCDPGNTPPPIGNPLQVRSNAVDPNSCFIAAEAPAAVNLRGVIYLFYTCNNALYVVTSSDARHFSGARVISGTEGHVFSAPGACVNDTPTSPSGAYESTLWVMFQSEKNGLRSASSKDGVNWIVSGQISFNDQPLANVYSAPSAAGMVQHKNRSVGMHVYWIDSSQRVNYIFAPPSWTLGPTFTQFTVSNSPAAVSGSDDDIAQQYVFFRDTGGHLFVFSLDPSWFRSIPVRLEGSPGVAAYGDATSSFKLFHLADNGGYYVEGIYNPGVKGQGSDAPIFNVNNAVKGVSPVYWNGMIFVFYLNADTSLWYVQGSTT